jgi:RNA recognition motif-containing protein
MLKGLINRIFYPFKSVNKLKLSSFHKNQFFKMSNASQTPTPQPKPDNIYKLLYVENIPRDWNEEDIKSRFQQIGNVEKVHIIKNALGDPTGKIVVHYEKIENIVNAIEKFHNKCPDLKPLKLKFFRKLGQTKEHSNQLKNVLLIKNLPYEVTVDDMKLMLEGVAQPVHIALPRDE